MSTKTTSKSRYRSQAVSTEPSQLLVGPSISTQLRNSSYGRFHEYLQQSGIQAELQQDFQLPRVIVVGGRSAGKSSLLESITKCPIFPRHQDFCTKMPIELHMQNDPAATERQVTIRYLNRTPKQLQAAHEILAEVNTIMEGVKGIDGEPIIIEICQADLPTFKFVDLPGIQTYPAEQEIATTNLVNTYLNKPNTLVLCVVDATTSAFDTSVALKLIRIAGKLSNTIIAMTKSDLVTTEEEYVPKIFDRILGESSDNEHLQEIAGCVAVASCSQKNDPSTSDADLAERQVFSRMLQDPAEAFAAPETQCKLKDHMTVRQLIVQLDRMFHTYIVKNWKPAALKLMAQFARNARKQRFDLGPPVEKLSADEIMGAVLKQVDKARLCYEMQLILQATTHSSHKESCCSTADWSSSEWGSVEWAQQVAALRDQFETYVQHLPQQQHLQQPARISLMEVFLDLNRLDPPLKLRRFASLRTCVLQELLPAFTASVLSHIKPDLDFLLQSSIMQLYTSSNLNNSELPKSGVIGCIVSHFMFKLQCETETPKMFRLPESFQLEEDEATQQRRADLHLKIHKLQTAFRQIWRIEDAFSTPECPTAATVRSVFDQTMDAQQHIGSSVPSAVSAAIYSGPPVYVDPPAVLDFPNLQASDSDLARAEDFWNAASEPYPDTPKAAQLETKLEEVSMSPTASVADSFVHVP